MPAAKLILVVEDEQPIREMIAFSLRRAGFEVGEAPDSRTARVRIADRRPDLVIVDWMLPDGSGLELTRQLKRDGDTRELPVIMLTARAAEGDKVSGLESGADDYITKPFSPRELVARINAVLRRTAPGGPGGQVRFGTLTLDAAAQRVTAGKHILSLGPTEYRLLAYMMCHPELVLSRRQLLDRVWGGNSYPDERTVDVHIRRVRKALEASGCDRYVQTVRGAGYRFSAAAE